MKKLSGWFVLLAIGAQTAYVLQQSERVHCSSYLDDFFLPTAKLALNKIQQSLSPVQIGNQSERTNSTSETVRQDEPMLSEKANERASAAEKETEKRVEWLEEPKKSEFVKLDVVGNLEASSDRPVAPAADAPISSTETVEIASSSAGSVAGSSSEQSASTGEPPTEGAAVEEASGKSEEKVRDVELEAQMAVDASIGFGLGSDLFGSISDSCYDEYGNARFCEPDFENAAFERSVEASSECGQPATRFCSAFLNDRLDQIRNCHICDAHNPKKQHPAAYLTDLNNANAPTCWVSAPIASQSNSSEAVEWSANNKLDNVTLLLNLDKKYEIVYISMQFCSMKPDSLAIYKSADFGRTWSPYQFYSSHCQRVYNRPARSPASSAPLEATCLNATQPSSTQNQSQNQSQSATGNGSANLNSNRIAFSTLEGRTGGSQAEKSSLLQDWVTATNIKIVLDRHQPNWLLSSLHAHHHSSGNESAGEQSAELTSPSDTFNYAMSDLIVGGRCKCNGHASRCIHSKEGRLQCDCRHNTNGRDCDKCAPFHFDRPWQRATQMDASPCQPCNCNGHSRKCRFDADLYRLSGRRSGGVCLGCRDNTAGRHCHYCKEGFTRDHSKPMSDKEACKHCDCHPIGASGRVCNQTSGQCPCKEGVTGLQCNRCAAGYQQSSSLSEPCIKLPENDINYVPPPSSGQSDEQAEQQSQNENPSGNEPSIVFSEQPRAPSAGGQQSAGNRIDPFIDLAAQTPDKDDDSELDEPNSNSNSNSKKPNSARPQLAWRPSQRKSNSYFRQHDARPNRHHFEQADDEQPNNVDSGEQNEYPVYLHQQQPTYSSYNYRFAPDFRKRRPFARRPNEMMMQPMNGFDPDESNLYDDPDSGYPLYSDDSFNQIQPSLRRTQKPIYRDQAARHHIDVGVSCGDCQAASRRLVFKQFCHLDYALKATILNRLVADDWTKLEVEIQDIFKSKEATASRQAGNVNSDNMLQVEQNRTQVGDQQVRLKVSSVQSIWIPTEDLNCKCPKPKLRSTYLLMGSIDSKNSANWLQLDRHGVALEWKSSLQEKLIKYQRRFSRGKC